MVFLSFDTFEFLIYFLSKILDKIVSNFNIFKSSNKIYFIICFIYVIISCLLNSLKNVYTNVSFIIGKPWS